MLFGELGSLDKPSSKQRTLIGMATLQRFSRCFLHKNHFLAATTSLIKQTRCCEVVAGSTRHTLSVRRKIEETKEAALQGGGKKRIDKQHQKVSIYIGLQLCIFNFSPTDNPLRSKEISVQTAQIHMRLPNMK